MTIPRDYTPDPARDPETAPLFPATDPADLPNGGPDAVTWAELVAATSDRATLPAAMPWGRAWLDAPEQETCSLCAAPEGCPHAIDCPRSAAAGEDVGVDR